MGLGRTAVVAPPAKGIAAPPTGKPLARSYAPAAMETLAAIMRDSNQPPGRARMLIASFSTGKPAQTSHSTEFKWTFWSCGSSVVGYSLVPWTPSLERQLGRQV